MNAVAFLVSSGLLHDDCLPVHSAGRIATHHTNHLEAQKASWIIQTKQKFNWRY